MTTITIEVLKTADISPGPTGKTYKTMVLTHTDLGTKKTDGKKMIDIYTDKTLWAVMAAAKPGDVFTIDRVKNDKGFWEWKTATPTTAAAAAVAPVRSDPPAQASGTDKPARVGSWETPDERALKQIYIVRQSSINAAIELTGPAPIGTDKQLHAHLDIVLGIAKRFENYVFDAGVAGLASDDFPE